jgi:hypothetical protein
MLPFITALLITQATAQEPIDLLEARATFKLVQSLWDADKGKLWGTSLVGPMIFVEPKSRRAVSNYPDGEGILRALDGMYVGTLPPKVPVANFSVKWAGVQWIMVVWPLPSDARDKAILLMHEPFHRVQAALGFPSGNPKNAHLEERDGRYWLQLEWRALRRAIDKPEVRKDAVADALLFREVRRSLYPDARVEERQLEMHEGLANYTGYALGVMDRDARLRRLSEALEKAELVPSFTRSFAYYSGPAYGLLLDEANPKWRVGLKATDDLGEKMREALALAVVEVSRQRAELQALQYGGSDLTFKEGGRVAQMQQMLSQFTTKPHLTIPLRKMQMSFDPNAVFPADKHGTIYRNLKVIDTWGILTTSEGGLISSNYQELRVSIPLENSKQTIAGQGWSLELNPGWKIQRDKREGDWVIVEGK